MSMACLKARAGHLALLAYASSPLSLRCSAASEEGPIELFLPSSCRSPNADQDLLALYWLQHHQWSPTSMHATKHPQETHCLCCLQALLAHGLLLCLLALGFSGITHIVVVIGPRWVILLCICSHCNYAGGGCPWRPGSCCSNRLNIF